MSNSHAETIVIQTLADLDIKEGATLSNAVKVFRRLCLQEVNNILEIEVDHRPGLSALIQAMEAEGFERVAADRGSDTVMLGVFQSPREGLDDPTFKPWGGQYASIVIVRLQSSHSGVTLIREEEYVFAFGIKGTAPGDEVWNPLSDDGEPMVKSEVFLDWLKTFTFIG